MLFQTRCINLKYVAIYPKLQYQSIAYMHKYSLVSSSKTIKSDVAMVATPSVSYRVLHTAGAMHYHAMITA